VREGDEEPPGAQAGVQHQPSQLRNLRRAHPNNRIVRGGAAVAMRSEVVKPAQPRRARRRGGARQLGGERKG
jgi:hypothetical protein